MPVWYELPLKTVEKELRTDFEQGLKSSEIEARHGRHGWNELKPGKPESAFVIFLRQFRSPLVYLLVAATAILFLLGEHTDAWLIVVVLLFNSIIGAFQEGKASNTLLALRSFSESTATVLRDGKEMIIPDKDVVPGDVILIQEGEKIPADARVVEENSLRVDEAPLTGESTPVHKSAETLKAPLTLAMRANMVHKGTAALGGSGKAVVVAIGVGTEIGKISESISSLHSDIPLQKEIGRLSRMIIVATIVLSALIFAAGIYFGRSIKEMFSLVVALAISVVPEGLPVVLTLILASGVWRMAKRNALVKRLQAVEALGSASVIAVDKTGTLTRNEMVVREAFADEKLFSIRGEGYEPKGEVFLGDKVVGAPNHPELLLLGKISALTAKAKVAFWEDQKVWKVAGDPTEAAMLVFSEKLGFKRTDIESEMPLSAEEPFDYKKKYHITSHKTAENQEFLSLVGAPEVVLSFCTKISIGNKAETLSLKQTEELTKMLRHMSKRGLRVVACAYRVDPARKKEEDLIAKDLVFVGFLGIQDSLRAEVPEAMRNAREAGVRVVMITGDSKITAVAIAKEAGIWREGEGVLSDEDIMALSPFELQEKVKETTVFSRITPEHKMEIIKAYRRGGEAIAMTGDGVNDAPSLVAADLGVAMGKIGTEVAKEASDIVLLDDNFGSIIPAIEEGRSILRTIRKVILFLFSTSFGEIVAIGGSILVGLPPVILPAQILWLNLVTDSVVAFALGFDTEEKSELMKKPGKDHSLITNEILTRIFLMGIPIGAGSLMVFFAYASDITRAYTMTLTVLAMFQWFNGWNCRSATESVFSSKPWANRYLFLGTAIAAALQIAAVHIPATQKLLHLSPLSPADWGAAVAVSFSIIFIEELRKVAVRRWR